jgi:ABC-type antimicrobial peptide transport system permease subunit
MRLVANGVAVVLRTKGDPASIMGSVRDAAAGFDSGAVIYAEETMNEVISNSLAARHLSMILLSLFSGIALILSCVGIYGVISYLVEDRTHEIGVRMALGAERADVLRLILGQGAAMATLGIGMGVFLTLGLARLISNQLYGVTPHDPLTFCSAGFALMIAVMTACYVPAKRAIKVDPLVALRYE